MSDHRERNDPLKRDVSALGAILGETILSAAGGESFQRIEAIRRLSRGRRLGDPGAEQSLREAIGELDLDGAEEVIRAFTLFFDFANIAEDRHRIRVLRWRERDAHPKPLAESIGAAVMGLHAAGRSANEVQGLLHELSVDLVFTAHPSEAKRRTVRGKLRRMRQYLQQTDRQDLLPTEREDLERQIRTEALVLWQTEPLRPRRPTVLEEVDRALALAPRLWEAVPHAYAEMRHALEQHYPGVEFDMPPFIRFGFWVGGDRDGHPDVTNDVTRETLRRLRHAAIALHLEQCHKLHDLLSVSDRLTPVSAELKQRLADAQRDWPEAASSDLSQGESYRAFLDVVAWRLAQSQPDAPTPSAAYRDGRQLMDEIDLLIASLKAHVTTEPLVKEARTWRDLTCSFGLQLARLDMRQDSAVIGAVVADVFKAAEIASDYDALGEREKCEVLSRHLAWAGVIDEAALSPETREMLGLFALIEETIFTRGPEAIGGFIISMTRAASDVLAVLWLWRHAQQGQGNRAGELRIIPLFERIGDLEQSAETLESILSEPAYLRSLAKHDFRQMVMLGYSDSTKDGGYLAACWGLWKAQTALQTVASRHGIEVTFFHGRGGSLGRGGGPAARGILSLPRKTFHGALRLTEQGEVLVERYDDTQIAARHLDQVVWASMTAASEPGDEPDPAWLQLMETIAQNSYAAYKDLVDTPEFLKFFALATPIDEIEELPIGSRPARRRARTSLADLRAIPWVFSWTQNRCIIPAWYGLGTALEAVPNGTTLTEIYQRWPFFEATIDNAELALAKADLWVAERYAELTGGEAKLVWEKIQAEYERARRAILKLTGRTELLAEVPWFQASIEARNPYVDPLNLIQIELLRRRRAANEATPPDEIPRLRHLLRLSIQGVAAGLRTTG